MSVLIIGASVAGVAAADGLRSQGFEGAITLVDSDPNLPYDKPPLSKQALSSDWEAARGLLRPAQHYADNKIDLVLGRRAVSLDAKAKSVTLEDGTVLSADAIVLATGVTARTLPVESMLPGVHSIRTHDDSVAVRRALIDKPKLVIVGGGFIGAETAAVAAKMGIHVTIIELLERPFSHLFGLDVADALSTWHTDAGVRLECGVGVERLEGTDKVERVVLTDGRVIETDLVVLGLGAAPATDWLEGSGIAVENGIVCDEFGHTCVPGIYAGGDAAAWWDPRAEKHLRVEHWTTAKEHGTAIAHNIMRSGEPGKTAGPVPYFWSDQYGRRMQFLGTSAGYDSTDVVHGSLEDGEFVVLYGRDGLLIGALGAAATRQLMKFRPLVERRAPIADLVPEKTAAGV